MYHDSVHVTFPRILIGILPQILGFTEKCLAFFLQDPLTLIIQIALTSAGIDLLIVGYIDTRVTKNQKPFQKNSRNCDHDQTSPFIDLYPCRQHARYQVCGHNDHFHIKGNESMNIYQ